MAIRWKCALLVSIFLFLIILISGGHAQEDFPIEVWPEQPSQGETVFISITSKVPFQAVFFEFEGRTIPAYPIPSGYLGILGLAADLKEGEYPVILRAVAPEGSTIEKVLTLPVALKDYGQENITLPPAKKGLPESPKLKEASRIVRTQLKVESPQRFWTTRFIRPVAGKVTASYGIRRVLDKKTPWGYHSGVDFAGEAGDPVYAPAPGKVLLAEELEVFGKCIVLDHGQGVVTIYQHLSALEVQKGDLCLQGQKIGKIGSTGLATGPHLHWGLYVHNVKVDPLKWLELPLELVQKLAEPSLTKTEGLIAPADRGF